MNMLFESGKMAASSIMLKVWTAIRELIKHSLFSKVMTKFQLVHVLSIITSGQGICKGVSGGF
jgi:hypothetical protein